MEKAPDAQRKAVAALSRLTFISQKGLSSRITPLKPSFIQKHLRQKHFRGRLKFNTSCSHNAWRNGPSMPGTHSGKNFNDGTPPKYYLLFLQYLPISPIIRIITAISNPIHILFFVVSGEYQIAPKKYPTILFLAINSNQPKEVLHCRKDSCNDPSLLMHGGGIFT
jgi:hypothetical protein